MSDVHYLLSMHSINPSEIMRSCKPCIAFIYLPWVRQQHTLWNCFIIAKRQSKTCYLKYKNACQFLLYYYHYSCFKNISSAIMCDLSTVIYMFPDCLKPLKLKPSKTSIQLKLHHIWEVCRYRTVQTYTEKEKREGLKKILSMKSS